MLFATINQYCELHAFRPAKVDQLIERRADGASGVKHIVNEHDVTILNVSGQICAVNDWLGADRGKIVAIQRYVENPNRRAIAFKIRDLIGHSFSERDTPAAYSDQIQITGAVVFFHNLRSEAGQRAIDSRAVHDACLLDEIHFAGY